MGAAYRTLVEELALDSSCGYVTFLRTETSASKSKSNAEKKRQQTTNARSASTPAKDAVAAVADAPLNGLVSAAAGDLLGAELEDLETALTSEERALRSDVDVTVEVGDRRRSRRVDGNDADWVLLDCHFGIPLFDAELNGEICARVISEKLFCADNLEAMNKASRKLTLRLLQFIASMQDPAARHEFTNEVLTNPSWPSNPNNPNQNQSTVALPTQNLIFQRGSLSVWDGR